MIVAIIVLLVLIALYLYAIKGRTGHKELPALRGWFYAHRGLHSTGCPENSMAAFRAAKDHGYGIELDVHLTKDGNLAVIHDSSLKRTAGADVRIEDLTVFQLDDYRLDGTDEKIPLLSEVLQLYQGQAPLIVELKTTTENYTQLCESACKMLENYSGPYCIESFDPRCCAWLRRHRKEVIRGQLTENFLRTGGKYPWLLKFAMKHLLLNVFTRPDFIAYRFGDRKAISNTLCQKIWGVQSVAWTIRNKDDLNLAVKEDRLPIFENFIP